MRLIEAGSCAVYGGKALRRQHPSRRADRREPPQRPDETPFSL